MINTMFKHNSQRYYIFWNDIGHDVDDEVALRNLFFSINNRLLQPSQVTIIMTGDYPAQATLATYSIALDILGDAAYDITIIPTAPYTEKSPGSVDDILGSNGFNWTQLKKFNLKEIKNQLMTQNRYYKQNQNYTYYNDFFERIIDTIEDEPLTSEDSQKLCEFAGNYLCNLSSGLNKEIYLTLCARSGDEIDQLNSLNVVEVAVQGALDKEKKLGGFNNTNSKNLSFINRYTQNADSRTKNFTVFDTTAASTVSVSEGNLPSDFCRYVREKMQQWFFRTEELNTLMKDNSNSADTVKNSASFDPRLHGFAATWHTFSQERYFNNRFILSGSEEEKELFMNEFKNGLNDIAISTNPKNNSQFNKDVWLSCFETDDKKSFYLKPKSDLTPEQKSIIDIIENSKNNMSSEEKTLIENLEKKYPNVKLSISCVLYDPLVVNYVTHRLYKQVVEPQQNDILILSGEEPQYNSVKAGIVTKSTLNESLIVDMLKAHYCNDFSELTNIVRNFLEEQNSNSSKPSSNS